MKIDDKIAADLFRQYGKRLYNTALRITLSSYEAEEIMQDTLSGSSPEATGLMTCGHGCGGCA